MHRACWHGHPGRGLLRKLLHKAAPAVVIGHDVKQRIQPPGRAGDHLVQRGDIVQPVRIGAETRIVDQLGPPDQIGPPGKDAAADKDGGKEETKPKKKKIKKIIT
mgnify:CR=1 FL=1